MDLIGIDTESHAGAPFSIQVSLRPGTGILVRMSDTEAVAVLVDLLNSRLDSGAILVFHHAPADLPVMDLIGVRYHGRYRDTLQESYHLGLPQSLKVLGYRLFGVRMQDWSDLVGAASREKLLERLSELLMEAALTPDLEWKETRRGAVKVVEKPSIAYRTLEGIFKFGMKSPDYDIESRLKEIEQQWGLDLDLPEKGIGWVPEEEAVEYAVRDADVTLQLAVALEEERERLGYFGVREEDHDR